MNIQDTAKTRSAYAIGQPVPRKEDATLLRGEGRYTDDINLPNQAHAFILRSSVAHGRIKSIDTGAARKMKGVLAVYTGADVAQYGTLQSALPFKSKDGTDLKKPPRPALPTDKVRFVGDPIACVVAETLLQAKDAAEAIEVDIEPLPVVTTPAAGGRARRACAVRQRAGQHLPRLPLRRHRQGGRGVRRRPSTRSSSRSSTPAWSSTRSSRAPRSAATTRPRKATRSTP